jgi:hypothetical protein
MCDRPGRRAAAGAGVAAFYQLATGPASAALAGAQLRTTKERKKQSCKARGRGRSVCKSLWRSDHRASAILPRRSAPLNDPRLQSYSFRLRRIAVSNPFQILTDGVRMAVKRQGQDGPRYTRSISSEALFLPVSWIFAARGCSLEPPRGGQTLSVRFSRRNRL